MLTRIRSFFAAPVFEDEEKTRVARLLNSILLALLGITVVVSCLVVIVAPQSFSGWIPPVTVAIMIMITVGMRWLVQRGNTSLIGALLSFALLVIVTFLISGFGGVTSPTTAGYGLCIIIASLLLGGRSTIVFTILSVLTVGGMWFAGQKGWLPSYPSPEGDIFPVFGYGTIFVLSGLLLRYAVNSLRQALERARQHERAQMEANRELRELRASLEQQITDRTADLEHRSNYLEASAAISHAASSILEPDQLMRKVVDLIRERFGLYYAGLFLLDEAGQWAEFRAGTGEVGRLLQEQELRLEVGGNSMVGWCTANAQARVAQDVRSETTRIEHPLLTATQSEVALPLVARGRVIGALNAQSDWQGAFDADTVAVLQTMCDQVAVALDNARLFVESQAALEAERRAYGELSRQAWVEMLRAGLVPGYRYANKQVAPLDDVWPPEMQAALREERQVVRSAPGEGQARTVIAAPIKVRGQTIGVIDVRKDEHGSEWTPEEIALLEMLTDQLGLALDSARLYEESQRLAAREQVINTSTANIRGAATVDAILRRTVEELGRAFSASRASVRLEISEPKQ